MENIEQKIKERLMHVAPSRELFDKTMNQVTKNNLNRNTILEGEAPSPYQSQFSNIMKKITFIGVPAIAFAVFAIFFISGNKSYKLYPNKLSKYSFSLYVSFI